MKATFNKLKILKPNWIKTKFMNPDLFIYLTSLKDKIISIKLFF